MTTDPRRSIWREPRPADVPALTALDWVLVGVLEAAAVLEGLLRPQVTGRLAVTLVAMAVIPVLLWRRSHPLVSALLGFGVAMAMSIAQLVTRGPDLGLYSMGMIMLLLYSLVRWGSGREVVIGLLFVAVAVGLGMVASFTAWGDVVGGTVFVLAFAAVAAVVRYRADLWQRQFAEVRNQERLELARELHDTVAHHVSAIAVQAQAGRVVAATAPDQAVAVLSTIEAEASRTLAEMRAMVRVLRDGDTADYAPQPGVAGLPRLARPAATPAVDVRLGDGLEALPGSVDTAVFRLAQESLTNALRHARQATRVEIDVRRDGDEVALRVSDDGRLGGGAVPAPGFGLLGMVERAELLGGSLRAGPGPDGGWLVEARLPAGGAS